MNQNVTRGFGLLEGFLAKQRAKVANKLIDSKLREGRILDIGCGTTPLFLLNTIFAKKYGLDPSVSKTNFDGISLQKSDIEKVSKLSFEDEFFEVITMLAVFEHIEPFMLVDILKEVKRVLKPGGSFILTTPCEWTDKLLRTMAALRLVSSKEIEEHKDTYNHEKIAYYLNKAGFCKEKMTFGYFEFFLNNWACIVN